MQLSQADDAAQFIYLNFVKM